MDIFHATAYIVHGVLIFLLQLSWSCKHATTMVLESGHSLYQKYHVSEILETIKDRLTSY